QAACSGLAQDVVFCGAQPHAEVMRVIQKAALFALPCVVGEDGDRDGLPTVLLEAMALGTPVISCRVAGIPEIITHRRTGLLVEERNAVALGGAIESLLDDCNLQEELRRAALAKVRDDFNVASNVCWLKRYFLTTGEPV